MKNMLKNIFSVVICIFVIQIVFSGAAFAANITPNSAGLFDNSILEGMSKFMHATYHALGRVLMIGHALMCYAINVDYTCVFVCALAKIPNLSFLIAGAVIYVVGVLMSLSVGMYFVDISFKIGFAVLFMPVSIALWPFPPTKNKFSENLNIIIRNGMLFMMVAVGVAFAVTLISEGLMEGGEEAFRDAINEQKTETLSEQFSLTSLHILVVGFSLIFGLKILESSVNNYLNAFFSDPAFGRSSPMHHLGTQAVGLVTQNAVKPALSFAKDVATHQTGRAIAGVGKGISKLSYAEGRQEIAANIGNKVQGMKRTFNSAANKALHPRQTYNQAMQYAGKQANRAIQAAGTGAKVFHDYFTAFAPTPFAEDDRQLQVKWFNSKIDKLTNAVGNKVENVIAHGGEGVKQGIATGIAKANNMVQAQRGKPENMVSAAQVRAGLHAVRQVVEDTTEMKVQGGIAAMQQAGAAVAGVATELKTNIQQKGAAIAQKGAAIAQKAMDNKAGRLLKEAYQTSDQAPISLSPSKIMNATSTALNAPFVAVRHPIKTMKKIAQLPNMMEKIDKSVDEFNKRSLKDKTKIILKSSGQIVFRTAKDTVKDAKNAGENSIDAFGRILTGFGNSLADNSQHGKQKRTTWAEMQRREDERQQALREEQEYFAEMNVDN